MPIYFFFFFNDTATTEIYTLSLHDALPISDEHLQREHAAEMSRISWWRRQATERRSEEHTSELQSPCNLVCRLLLEKKKYSTASHHMETYWNSVFGLFFLATFI